MNWIVTVAAGCLVHISSIIGIGGNAGQTVYSASKAALLGFSRSLAKEVGERGMRSNVVAPGFIETDMTAGTVQLRCGYPHAFEAVARALDIPLFCPSGYSAKPGAAGPRFAVDHAAPLRATRGMSCRR